MSSSKKSYDLGEEDDEYDNEDESDSEEEELDQNL